MINFLKLKMAYQIKFQNLYESDASKKDYYYNKIFKIIFINIQVHEDINLINLLYNSGAIYCDTLKNWYCRMYTMSRLKHYFRLIHLNKNEKLYDLHNLDLVYFIFKLLKI